jgi:hypothetical protein
MIKVLFSTSVEVRLWPRFLSQDKSIETCRINENTLHNSAPKFFKNMPVGL